MAVNVVYHDTHVIFRVKQQDNLYRLSAQLYPDILNPCNKSKGRFDKKNFKYRMNTEKFIHLGLSVFCIIVGVDQYCSDTIL